MKLRRVCRVVLSAVVFVAVLFVANSPLVAAKPDPMFSEMLIITVDCSNASVTTMLSVGSDNYTLVRFPSGVDLNDTHLLNAVMVEVIVSPLKSWLDYMFEGITEVEARSNADAVTPSISTAFGVSFTHNSTGTVGTQKQVNYTGPGRSGMTSFVNSMVSECVGADVNGFSDAIPSLAAQTTVPILMLSAIKESGGYDWTAEITLTSSSTIPTGSGPHAIDVLSLLGVSSLAPSPYSFNTTLGYYQSIVWLTINKADGVTFVSCVPSEATLPGERGWVHMFPTYTWASFYFGDDSSPVTALSFTFGGSVIPEFTPLTLTITLILTAACIIAFRKRRLRKNRSPAPLF